MIFDDGTLQKGTARSSRRNMVKQHCESSGYVDGQNYTKAEAKI